MEMLCPLRGILIQQPIQQYVTFSVGAECVLGQEGLTLLDCMQAGMTMVNVFSYMLQGSSLNEELNHIPLLDCLPCKIVSPAEK